MKKIFDTRGIRMYNILHHPIECKIIEGNRGRDEINRYRS